MGRHARYSRRGGLRAAAGVVPPVVGLSLTFEYMPSRDGLALLTGGPSEAGYAANKAANPSRIWQPRRNGGDFNTKGNADTVNGSYTFWADPEYAWSNGFSPFAIVGSDLRIRAARTSTLGFQAGEVPNDPASGSAYQYVSGLLSTQNSFTQPGGYVEMVAKLPRATGTWPAFWLFPSDDKHPPEIDVIEYISTLTAQQYQSNLITSSGQNTRAKTASVDLSLDYHRYGAYWDDSTIQFYCDGVAFGATVDISAIGDMGKSWYLLMANQVGSRASGWVPAPDGTTPDTLDMLVRSVRMWQKPGPVQISLSGTSYLDSVTVGGTVATISSVGFGGSTGHTYSEVSDTDNVFTVSGSNLNLSQAIPATTDSLHPVTLRVTDSLGRTRTRPFDITVLTATPTQANYIASSDLTTSGWAKEQGTAASANTFREDATTNQHDLFRGSIARTAAAKTFNFWVEATANATRTWLHCAVYDSSFGSKAEAWFDLGNVAIGYAGTAGAWSSCVPFLSDMGSGKYRVGLKFITDATTTGFGVKVNLALGQDNESYAGSTSAGMQFENFWLYNINAGAGGS